MGILAKSFWSYRIYTPKGDSMKSHSYFLRSQRNLALLSLLVLGCAGCNRQPTRPLGDPPIPVTAVALRQAYQENEAAARDRFGGKSLAVTGTILRNDLVNGQRMVTLVGREGAAPADQSAWVFCTFDASQGGSAENLQAGQTVTIQGICSNNSRSSTVSLIACRL
jgi:hypothetical protein